MVQWSLSLSLSFLPFFDQHDGKVNDAELCFVGASLLDDVQGEQVPAWRFKLLDGEGPGGRNCERVVGAHSNLLASLVRHATSVAKPR